MSTNPAVKLIVQPLRKLLDVADYVDSWRDDHKEHIASTKAELENSTESVDDRVEISLLQDPFAFTIFIEDAAEKIDGIGEPQIANQFRSLLEEVDEVEGDEKIPMDVLWELLDLYCPARPTDAEAIYLGNGKIKVGDTEVKWTNKTEIRMLEYLVKHRNADTYQLKRDVRISNPSESMARMQKRDGGRLAKFISRPGQKGEGGYSTTIIDGR